MSEKFDEEEISGDFEREWLASYFHRGEYLPSLNDLDGNFFGMNTIPLSALGSEIIPDEDRDQEQFNDESEEFYRRLWG
jgi:hypothetical protein